MLHLEHVGQAEGHGGGGDEREEHREYGEGRDVEPDQVDEADVRRLDASIKQHAHLVGVRVRVRVRARVRVRVRVRVSVSVVIISMIHQYSCCISTLCQNE